MKSIKHPRRRENRKPVGVARMVAAGAHATARATEPVDTSAGDQEAARATSQRRRNGDQDQAHDKVEASCRSTKASVITRIIILVEGMKVKDCLADRTPAPQSSPGAAPVAAPAITVTEVTTVSRSPSVPDSCTVYGDELRIHELNHNGTEQVNLQTRARVDDQVQCL